MWPTQMMGPQILLNYPNGNELGQFRTVAQTGNGNYWNVILTTGAFGNYTRLLVGRNTLTLTVLQADTFGVEIDKVTLAVECTQCPEIEFTASTSQSLPSEHGNSLSDGAIIGIVQLPQFQEYQAV